ncbi:hypothetical protein COB11_04410 [Candidatus Aerophobetes bacterium]|uniref:CheW-like domain-containing protein n=1 Tax=Aerophobetes bacterium TaxID=2030807 RepID=A0A2A4YI59_UNCAE|nr:MAG: hypothetical protein COB11_04410 [Candidatus Aerophobetes bacterium]
MQKIDRVVRACSIRPVPNTSTHIIGMLDLQGSVIPVIGFRTILGMESKEIGITDMMTLCETSGKQIAILVDLMSSMSYFRLFKSNAHGSSRPPERTNRRWNGLKKVILSRYRVNALRKA